MVDYCDSLDDGEFWDFALNGNRPGDVPPEFEFVDEDLDDRDFLPDRMGQECPVCHERGACGYDGEGRPLIHVNEGADDE